MGKGNRNRRNPDYYKVAGGAVEDRDRARNAKRKVSAQRKPGPRRAPPVPPVTERQANERRSVRTGRLRRLARGVAQVAETAVDVGRAVVAVVRRRAE